jgi:ribonuclease M5
MIKIDKAIIVEGKYDKIKLSSILDAVIIETDGFAVFKNKEKQKLIRNIAQAKGIVILTDNDAAGFKIRSFIGGSLPVENVVHAYIPDVFGKEKRKDKPSKEGKIGVEGIPSDIIIKALKKAGVSFCQTQSAQRRIEREDFYRDGLTGGKCSRSLRLKLLKRLDLPSRLSTNSLLGIINAFVTYDEYKEILLSCKEELNDDDK